MGVIENDYTTKLNIRSDVSIQIKPQCVIIGDHKKILISLKNTIWRNTKDINSTINKIIVKKLQRIRN